jgi:hypothetical protein
MNGHEETLPEAVTGFGMVIVALSGVLLYWAFWAAMIYIPCHFVAKYW